jgi:hypothetical protein
VKFDRQYFKKKANPKADVKNVTKCCGQSLDRKGLKVNRKADMKLIEDHIEEHLRIHSSVKNIKLNSCSNCKRLIGYISELYERDEER